MAISKWQSLLETIEVTGELCPTSVADLDKFEQNTGFKLPASYRDYSVVFGPGVLVRPFRYRIAVPGKPDRAELNELKKFNQYVRESNYEYKEYCPDPDQFQRAWFFGTDLATSWYFWDPQAVTDPKANECKIFVMHREWNIELLAASFWEFVSDVCLGKGVPGYNHDESIERVFQPECD